MGGSEGQGTLKCSSPWDGKESDMTLSDRTTLHIPGVGSSRRQEHWAQGMGLSKNVRATEVWEWLVFMVLEIS